MRIEKIDIRSLQDAQNAIGRVGADDYSIHRMARKAYIFPLLITGIDNRAANIIKQEILACGGEAAVNRNVAAFKQGNSSILILATPAQYERLIPKLKQQPFGLPGAGVLINAELARTASARKSFPQVMAILNVTPDSFSAGGFYHDPEAAVARSLEMINQGADIIDVGGESSRPGARTVPIEEEKHRVVPVILSLRKKTKKLISIDTCKPAVAQAALDAGADIINDITGLRYQKGSMAALAARANVPVVIMHMHGTPRTMQKHPHYADVVADIYSFFEQRIAFAVARGIRREHIILDPGIGFGKTAEHNITILRRLHEFSSFGCPLLVGASRKSFIGSVTGVHNPADRSAGSVAAGIWAVEQGAGILRVHDVQETCAALKITGALSLWN
ncbi:MAG: dihydropteroate synthase [Endomicrobiales bacterium]|jgi:dihydropteroate synthase